MKMNKMVRVLSLALCLALLLPATLVAPGMAAEPEAMEMYHFVASATVTDNIEAISSNNINTKGDRYPQMARPAYVMTKYTPNGPVVTPTAGFTEGVTVSSTYGTYGLPYSDSNSMGKRLTTNLAIVPEDMGMIITKGKEVVNVELDYVFRASTKARNVAFDDMMRVYVSLDGKTWLEDSVGMRCYTVDAPGVDHQGLPVVFYKIQTENLLDIDGVEPGARIHKIKIMPDGTDNRVQTGHFIISEMRVNGYKTKAEFEQLHPVRKQFMYVEPDTLRQIVLEEGIRTAEVEWTTDYNLYSCSPGSSSTLGGQGTVSTFTKDFVHHGPIYERNSDAFRERHQAGIVDGKHVAGYAGDLALGMDCQTFAYNAVSRVSRTNANGVLYWLGPSGARFIDGIKHADRPTWTDTDIKPYNTEQEMYEAYAKCKTGDVPYVYVTAGGVHVRIVNRVEVVRNPDGTINGEKSIMYCTEQGGTRYMVRMANGTQRELQDMNDEAVRRFLNENPGSKLLFASSSHVENPHTFKQMYSGNYCVSTLTVYDDGMVELADTQAVFMGKGGEDFVKTGAAIGFASNYTIIRYDVQLVDRGTGRVLYSYDTYMPDNCTRCWTFTSDELDAVLKNLTNGDYSLTLNVEAGPLTQLGQSQAPITTFTEDFTVTGKPAASQVTLNAPASAAKGEEVTVEVKVNKSFDAADVTVKFDQDKLAYVGGEVTAAGTFKTVTQNKGEVRMAAVDAKASAGTLAKLTFKALDTVDVAKAVTVKDAAVTTAEQANTGAAGKATQATKPCPGINMADVAANAWYHNAVDYALDNSLMSGYNATTFGPNDKLSRAMVVQVLYNKEGKPAQTEGGKFPDVKAGDWYNAAVAWAAANKVVGGYGDGRFGPNDNVTLEQIAVILHNYSGTPEGSGVAAELGAHSDWAANALAWAHGEKLFRGLPYEAVTETATRAQTAQLLMNFLSK